MFSAFLSSAAETASATSVGSFDAFGPLARFVPAVFFAAARAVFRAGVRRAVTDVARVRPARRGPALFVLCPLPCVLCFLTAMSLRGIQLMLVDVRRNGVGHHAL